MKRVHTWFLILTLAVVGCAKKEEGQGGPGIGKGPPAFPVETTVVETRPVEYAVHAVGSVEAFEQVFVTARVAGVVEEVSFQEGDQVDSDQTLVKIEGDRYQQSFAAAEANRQRAEVNVEELRQQLQRREDTNKSQVGAIAAEEISSLANRVKMAEADLLSARAAEEQARLNSRDAFVRAPVSGVIESRKVSTGQYVQPGTTLATLLRRDPLLLRFHLPDSEATSLQPGMSAHFKVKASDKDYEAEISFVGQAADKSTRMVEVLAKVGGAPSELRPGAFAEVTVPVGGSGDAPVIPQIAVRPSERGFLAYVIDGDIAHQRVLTLGLRTEDGLVEVRSGLTAGEILVVRGAEPLREGASVRVMPPSPTAPDQVSAGTATSPEGQPGPSEVAPASTEAPGKTPPGENSATSPSRGAQP